MLQVENQTPFTAGLFLFPDPSGVDTLYVTVKATFEISSGAVRVAPAQLPLVPGDAHWGDAATTSLKYPGEAHPCKGASDVILVGNAHAPAGRPSPRFGLSLSVGKIKKTIHVFGDRTWQGGLLGLGPSAPLPVRQVPLVYERAYGGRHDLEEGRFVTEPRNPVGVGFRGKRSNAELKGTPMPNLEDPRQPLSSPGDSPTPAGVGAIPPAWQPRLSYAGTYGETWQKQRAPYLPLDFDARYFQAAPPDQIYPGHLQGGEPVELINASPEGVTRFTLPVCELAVEVRIAAELQRPSMHIETLLLEPDQGRFSLLWRGAVPCDKQALRVHLARLTVRSLQGVAA